MFNRIHRLRYCCPCLSRGTFLLRDAHLWRKTEQDAGRNSALPQPPKATPISCWKFWPYWAVRWWTAKSNCQRKCTIARSRDSEAPRSTCTGFSSQPFLPLPHVATWSLRNLNCITAGCGTCNLESSVLNSVHNKGCWCCPTKLREQIRGRPWRAPGKC